MTTFTVFTIIYYIAFVLLAILAASVYIRLHKAVKLIAGIEKGKTELTLKPEHYKTPDAFLLHTFPNFPISALVKILPGSFVGFGILGTFLGFSSGISGMRLTGNVEELFSKLDTFFLGLNTAFITSIAGVVLSVIYGTFCQWPLNRIKFHCARITSELERPVPTPAESAKAEFDTYTASLREMTKALLTAKESIEVSLTHAVDKINVLPEKFVEVGRSLEETVAPVKETFSVMQTTLANYAQQAQAMQNVSEQVQNTLTKFIESSAQANQSINGTLEQAIKATKEIQENNASLIGDYKKMVGVHNALYEKLNNVQIKINEEIGAYSESIKNQFTQLLSEYAEQSQKILQIQNELVLKDRKQVLEDYGKIDANIASILETVNKNLGEYSATMEKTLVQTLEEYNKTAQKVTESFFGERS